MRVLPRLGKKEAQRLIDEARQWDTFGLSRYRPALDVPVTYPTAGIRIDGSEFEDLRDQVLETARNSGYPFTAPSRAAMTAFDGGVARTLHHRLRIEPHAASDDAGWTYVTCAWLMDVAVWRYGADASDRRFLGDVNRNTFRRLWWRAEVFGSEIDLALLQEDELVGIMERPGLSRDRRVAQTIVVELLQRSGEGAVDRRMALMRDVSKRLLRLTPFLALSSLSDDGLQRLVRTTFDESAAALRGEAISHGRDPVGYSTPDPSPLVSRLARVVDGTSPRSRTTVSSADIEDVALRLAASTGMVTNLQLRSETNLDTEAARRILAGLVEQGRLARRGVKRGSHYVIPPEVAQKPPAERDLGSLRKAANRITDEEDFWRNVGLSSPGTVGALEEFADKLRNAGARTALAAGLTMWLGDAGGVPVNPSVWTNGDVGVDFRHLLGKAARADLERLADQLDRYGELREQLDELRAGDFNRWLSCRGLATVDKGLTGLADILIAFSHRRSEAG